MFPKLFFVTRIRFPCVNDGSNMERMKLRHFYLDLLRRKVWAVLAFKAKVINLHCV